MSTANRSRPVPRGGRQRNSPGRSLATRFRPAVEWAKRHPVGAAAIFFGALSVAFVSPALLPGRTLSASDVFWSTPPWAGSGPSGIRPLGSNFSEWDGPAAFQIWLAYTRSVLPHIPLWDPYIMAGRPFLGNAQSAVFSPFSLPFYVLSVWTALPLVAALKLFVASFGAFLLARGLGIRNAGALLTGVIYGFNLNFVAMLPWPHTSVWALIPWMLLLTDQVVRRPGRLPLVALAFVVGLQFLGGHPESSFFAGFATVAFFALRLLQRPRSRRERRRIVTCFAGGLAAGTGLAALVLLPFFELLARSSDLQARHGADLVSKPSTLLEGLLPAYQGRPTGLILDPAIDIYANRPIYVGAIALMLVIAALVLRPTVERVAIAGFGLLCLCLKYALPGITDAFRVLPGFDTVKYSYLTIVSALCVALLAGWGLDDLAARRLRGTRTSHMLWGMAGLLLLPIAFVGIANPSSWPRSVAVAVGVVGPPNPTTPGARGPEVIHFSALLLWLAMAGAALALISTRLRSRGHIGAGAFVGLAVALAVIDLFRAGVGINPAIARSHAIQPSTGAIRFLQSQRPARFAGVGGGDFSPNLAMRYGLLDARGKDFPVDRHYSDLWSRLTPTVTGLEERLLAPLPASAGQEIATRMRGLDLLGVKSLIEAPDAPPPAPGLKLGYAGPDARVYQNPNALPRVFLVGRQQIVGTDAAALEAVLSSGFDGRQVAVSDRALPGLPQGGSAPPPRVGSARLTTDQAERVVIDASARQSSLLVLGDLYYPGWKATVDGRSTPIRRVDYLLRGVQLTPGRHQVEFRYQPASWRLGWIISLVTTLLLAGLLAKELRDRRRKVVACRP